MQNGPSKGTPSPGRFFWTEKSLVTRTRSQAHSFPGSAWERTAFEAPPRPPSRSAKGGGASKAAGFQAEPGNQETRTLTHSTHSFPGSAWERTAFEAPPRPPSRPAKGGGASKTAGFQAEPGNQETRTLRHSAHSFPGSAWERTASEAPPLSEAKSSSTPVRANLHHARLPGITTGARVPPVN